MASSSSSVMRRRRIMAAAPAAASTRTAAFFLLLLLVGTLVLPAFANAAKVPDDGIVGVVGSWDDREESRGAMTTPVGAADANTSKAEEEEEEEEEEGQREMLRRAIQLVEPYLHHHHPRSDGNGSSIGETGNDDDSSAATTPPIIIRDIHPPSGPVGGGTVVRITAEIDTKTTSVGPFLPGARRLLCRFAPLESPDDGTTTTATTSDAVSSGPASSWLVDATTRTPTIVTCPTPAVNKPVTTKLSLVDATTAHHVVAINRPSVSTTFAHYDQPIVVRLVPDGGPWSGGTVVAARISGYYGRPAHANGEKEDVVCRFGDGWVNGTLIGPHTVECASPPAPGMDGMLPTSLAVDVPFALSMNGGADFAPSGLRFAYVGDVRVRAVEPARGSTSGGTVIMVTGDNLHLVTDCAFGPTAAAYSYRDRETDDALFCVTSAVDHPERVELRLRTTTLGWRGTGMQFVYEAEERSRPAVQQQPLSTDLIPEPADFPISVLSMSPVLGPSTGGTNVTVTLNAASRSLSNATVLCWFGDAATTAEILTDGSVSCLSVPTFVEGGDRIMSADVTVTVDGVVSNGALLFTYHQLRRSDIVGVAPAAVDARGGSLIRIDCLPATNVFENLETRGFLGDIVVRVGQLVVPVDYDSALKEVVFVSPTFDDVGASKIVDVSISLNGGADFVPAPPLQVYPTPELYSVAPSVVELGQSGTIEITGSNFIALEDVTCQIGDDMTHAVVQSTTRILCGLPDDVVAGRAMPGILPVTISLNGIDYVEDVLTITVEDGVMVKRVLSPYASALGGTNVTLIGRNFHLLVLHRGFISLGDEGGRVLPHFTNETHAVFTAPAGAGEKGVLLALGATSVPVDTGLTLQYLPSLVIDEVRPPFGAAGGGYSITIDGTFESALDYICEIQTNGGLTIAAVELSVTSSNSAECEMPPTLVVGPASINILRIADGQRSNFIAFVFTEGLALTSIHPLSISELGGTVSVIGYGFDERSAISCFVETVGRDILEVGLVNNTAKWVSGEEVECTLLSLSVGMASLRIVESGSGNTSNPLDLYVHPAARILGLTPEQGATNGGTRVLVEAAGLEHYDDDLHCSFGSRLSHLNLLNATHGLCISPPFGLEESQVVFSAVRETVTPSGRRLVELVGGSSPPRYFTYRNPPKIQSITPRQGPAAGGTIVQITTDTNVTQVPVEALTLRLTSRSNSSRYVIAQGIIMANNGSVVAVLPPSPDGGNGGITSFELSINGQEYAHGGASFTFTPSMYIARISPPLIPAFSSFDIAVLGENFGAVPRPLWCRIGGITRDAVWISGGMTACPTPESLVPGAYELELSSNGVDFVSSPTQLLVRPEVRLSNASQLLGPVRGGGEVIVHGLGFLSFGEQFRCVFGAGSVEAHIVDDTEIHCKVPISRSGPTPFKLSIDRSAYPAFIQRQIRSTSSDILDTALLFQYYDDEIVESLSPSHGPERGGTAVSVHGRNFQDFASLSCKIGTAIVPGNYESSELVLCHVPPASEAFGADEVFSDGSYLASTRITVSNNGIDWLEPGFQQSATFSYYREPRILGLYPTMVPPAGGVVVQIQVVGELVEGHEVIVQVADSIVSANVSRQTVLFDAPRMKVGSVADVRISLNSVDFSTEAGELRYLDSPLIYEASPQMGPAWGLNTITLLGRNFDSVSDEMYVEFGPAVVPATIVSNTVATCKAPAHDVGFVSLRLVRGENPTGLMEYASDKRGGIAYEYLNVVMLDALSPRSSPTRGGTKVVVAGENFPGVSVLFCSFGGTTSAAEWLSTNQITCNAPSAIEPSMVPVNVGIVDADAGFVSLTQSAIQFRYYEEPRFHGLHPSRGLTTGGSVVKLTFDSFSTQHDSYHCRFGEDIMRGERIGDGVISCVAPSRDADGPVDLAVSCNNQDYHQIGSFNYHEVPSVLSVSPSHGWNSGGTKVAVFGVGFPPPDGREEGIVCDFGGRWVAAVYVDSSLVECTAPAHALSTVKLGIVYFPHAEEASIRAESNATFEYVDRIDVTRTFPEILPALAGSNSGAGGAGYLEVYGSNFRKDEVMCRFHLWLPSNATVSDHRELVVETASSFINASYVRCGPGVPGLDSFFDEDSQRAITSDETIVNGARAELSVTTNGQQISGTVPLSFAVDPLVHSIYPRFGSVSGRTDVIVRGQFMPTTTLLCRFGIKVVDALFVSETEIVCRAPTARHPAVMAVEVSVNGRDFSTSEVHYRYHEQFYLESITPALSPSIGGVTTVIKIGGTALDEDMQFVCRFNTSHTPAIVIDNSFISCISPAASSSEGGVVPVSVSANDGVDFVGSIDFRYFPGQQSETMFLSPTHGPESGGTQVEVRGLAGFGSATADLLEGLNGICRFGNIVVPATDISDDGISMVCTSPPKQEGSTSWLSVDVAYQPTEEALTTNGAVFIYDENVDLYDIWPAMGPLTGLTPVRIRGGPFVVGSSDELLCRFGEQIVVGTWHSKGEVGCVVPAIDVGSESVIVDVNVAINGQDFSESSLRYTYHPLVTVTKILPSHGPVSGGTIVAVEGEHFDSSSALTCWFGSVPMTPIEQVNSTQLICEAPPTLRPSEVEVHVSLNGFVPPYNVSAYAQIYGYEEVLRIDKVDPPFGPSRGNSSIIVSGGPFVDYGSNSEMHCRFGETEPVPAEFLSPSKVLCITPPHLPEIVTLQATQNAQDYSPVQFAFEYYPDEVIQYLEPAFGPRSGGSDIRVRGENFRNGSLTSCRFDDVQVPANFVNNTEISCESPVMVETDLHWLSLDQIPLNLRDGSPMFERGHRYPSYHGRAVTVEVSNNRLDYTGQTNQYWFYEDAELISLSATTGPYWGGTPIFLSGSNFINSTSLSCRIGSWEVKAQYLDRRSALCFTPPQALIEVDPGNLMPKLVVRPEGSPPSAVYVALSNNGFDFTQQLVFQYEEAAPQGFYNFGVTSESALPCPRGSFCSGGRNFTFCPEKSYQSLKGQDGCLSCPVGYHCPTQGMPVPRLCPAGRVCSEIGLGRKLKPCPAGFLCGPGTATLETTCSVRRSGCFDNSTNDFGLQYGDTPGRYWSERHLLPLDSTHSLVLPNRGRYCLDDSCLRLEDELNLAVSDRSFAYSSTGFNLRRPVPCRAGEYCGPGEAMNETSLERLSSPQLCLDSKYCPEGSSNPRGIGDCPKGLYCAHGERNPCPIGNYCPVGSTKPKPCRPGGYTFQVGQEECSECPQGYYCPNYGRIDPAICPPGLVCSKPGLASPNLRCPAGFYCQNGTMTSDPFRNDTTLRPYACAPGTYCLDGTGYDGVVEGDFLYAQPCPAGFFCEAASPSAVGTGACPPGFVCPKGTATPRPAPQGHVAEYLGTVEAAACLPGSYSPTIQSDKCYPCPSGTSCETEGLIEADICPPGQFSDLTNPDVPCTDCPQGTWSKNWHLREKGECTRLPTGVIGPIEGSTSPCSKTDLPTPYEPVVNLDGLPAYEYEHPTSPPFSIDECLRLNPSFVEGKLIHNQEYFYGELIPPYIDILGRGPHFRPSDDQSLLYSTKGHCYKNNQPDGSVLFRRMQDYYGPQIDIQFGRGGMSTRQFSILATVYRLWSCSGTRRSQ